MTTQKDWADSSNFVDEFDYDNIALMVISSEKSRYPKSINHGTWTKYTLILDCGCSGHMTRRKSLLAEFESTRV